MTVVSNDDFGAHGVSEDLTWWEDDSVSSNQQVLIFCPSLSQGAYSLIDTSSSPCSLWFENMVTQNGQYVFAACDNGWDQFGSDTAMDSLDAIVSWALTEWPGDRVGLVGFGSGFVDAFNWYYRNPTLVSGLMAVNGIHSLEYLTSSGAWGANGASFEGGLDSVYGDWDSVKNDRDPDLILQANPTLGDDLFLMNFYSFNGNEVTGIPYSACLQLYAGWNPNLIDDPLFDHPGDYYNFTWQYMTDYSTYDSVIGSFDWNISGTSLKKGSGSLSAKGTGTLYVKTSGGLVTVV